MPYGSEGGAGLWDEMCLGQGFFFPSVMMVDDVVGIERYTEGGYLIPS